MESEFNNVNIEGETIPGASLAGLGRRNSTLGVNQRILSTVKPDIPCVLNFGQVDIELGLYFRLVVKEEDIAVDHFIENLVETYGTFLREILRTSGNIVVKGINLTVIKLKLFGVNYVSRIITENIEDKSRHPELRKSLERKYHSLIDRNKISLDFNEALKSECRSLNVRYFDINKHIGKAGDYKGFDLSSGVDNSFVPTSFDHHLVDSVFVRHLHYRSILNILTGD